MSTSSLVPIRYSIPVSIPSISLSELLEEALSHIDSNNILNNFYIFYLFVDGKYSEIPIKEYLLVDIRQTVSVKKSYHNTWHIIPSEDLTYLNILKGEKEFKIFINNNKRILYSQDVRQLFEKLDNIFIKLDALTFWIIVMVILISIHIVIFSIHVFLK